MKIRIVTIALILVLLAITVAGCATQRTQESDATETGPTVEATQGAEETPVAKEGSGVLNLVWLAGIGTDSMFESPFHDVKCMYPYMLFSTLIQIDAATGEYTTDLADSYAVSDDGLVYTFKLNPNATFTDGEPVTAEDVKFSMEVALAFEKSYMKSYMKSINGKQAFEEGGTDLEGVVAVDDHTLEVTLDTPDNMLLIACCNIRIMPKHAFEGVALADVPVYEEFWTKPFGSGQYIIDEVSFPDYFTMVRNDDYFAELAGIENVLYTSFDTGGNDAVIAATIAGKLDYILGEAVNDSSTIDNITQQNPNITGVTLPSSYTRQFRFNLTGSTDNKYNQYMQDERVREAFSLLVDKAMVASFYGDQATPATTMVNPTDVLYNQNIPVYSGTDIERAKKLLDEAGYDYSLPVRFIYYYADQTTKDIMEVIRQNFAEVGVTFEPSLITGDVTAIIYEQKNWDMNYTGGGSAGDPVLGYNFLVPDGGNWDGLLGNVQERGDTYGLYYSQYSSSTDREEQIAAAHALQELEMADFYNINLYHLNKMIAYNSRKLELDTSIFTSDYEQAKDYKFETWKLIG